MHDRKQRHHCRHCKCTEEARRDTQNGRPRFVLLVNLKTNVKFVGRAKSKSCQQQVSKPLIYIQPAPCLRTTRRHRANFQPPSQAECTEQKETKKFELKTKGIYSDENRCPFLLSARRHCSRPAWMPIPRQLAPQHCAKSVNAAIAGALRRRVHTAVIGTEIQSYQGIQGTAVERSQSKHRFTELLGLSLWNSIRN